MGGGALAQIGSHIIDLITFITGQRAKRVHGVVRTFTKTNQNINGIRQISSDDFTSFHMELHGKEETCANVTINTHMNAPFQQEIVVCGSQGRLIARGGDLYGVKWGSATGKEENIFLDIEDLQNSHTLSPSIPKLYLKGLFKLLTALKESLISDNQSKSLESATSFEDGQYVMAVIEAIRESSSLRQWVTVNMIAENSSHKMSQSDGVISLVN